MSSMATRIAVAASGAARRIGWVKWWTLKLNWKTFPSSGVLGVASERNWRLSDCRFVFWKRSLRVLLISSRVLSSHFERVHSSSCSCFFVSHTHHVAWHDDVFVEINRQTLDSLGASMEVAKYTERLVPSSRIVSVDGVAPALPGANNFIAPSASVIGNVTIGEHSR